MEESPSQPDRRSGLGCRRIRASVRFPILSNRQDLPQRELSSQLRPIEHGLDLREFVGVLGAVEHADQGKGGVQFCADEIAVLVIMDVQTQPLDLRPASRMPLRIQLLVVLLGPAARDRHEPLCAELP